VCALYSTLRALRFEAVALYGTEMVPAPMLSPTSGTDISSLILTWMRPDVADLTHEEGTTKSSVELNLRQTA
jgi:hypothetical protein